MNPRETAYRAFVAASRALAPVLLPLNVAGRRGYHRGLAPSVPVALYAVYRRRNAAHVRRLVDGLPTGSRAHLHALDEVDPVLATWTRSSGPGLRMPLLQGLLDAAPPPPGTPVLLADDDVEFVGTGAARFPGYAVTAELDIAQPAHQPGSQATFLVTRVVPLSTVRETRFVEVGPLVLLSPRALPHVLPFAEEARMGWGLDVAWSGLRAHGLRLGVVDATPVVHHGVVAAAYDTAAEDAAQADALAATGVRSAHELAGNTGRTWRPWQRRPRWATAVRTLDPATPPREDKD